MLSKTSDIVRRMGLQTKIRIAIWGGCIAFAAYRLEHLEWWSHLLGRTLEEIASVATATVAEILAVYVIAQAADRILALTVKPPRLE